MAEAAFSFAVQKLTDLTMEKVSFLGGVEEQVKLLRNELERMQCFLKDADEKQSSQETIRKWISDIREVAQDAEDAIDGFILRVDTPARSSGRLRRLVHYPIRLHHLSRIGEEIESIRSRLQDIEKSRERYKIQLGLNEEGMMASSKRSEAVELRRRLSPWQKDKLVVGLEGDVETLVQHAKQRSIRNKRRLRETIAAASIAIIVGMGGIGKSTLARLVYNHADIVKLFELRAWVVVSREPDLKKIMMELMLQIVVEPREQLQVMKIMEKSPFSHIRQMLHKRLLAKRYFIVLDDVWEEEHWESLESAFPASACMILLTSRRQDILSSDILSPLHFKHQMKILDTNQSWELFLKKAFIDNNTEGKCPDNLKDIGEAIVKKCDGLPLAIAVTGGLLAKQKQCKSEWEKVMRGMDSHFGKGKSNVSSILELSYHHLSPQLKSCFLCLGFFKKNVPIRVQKLLQVWIAQGLISQGKGEETKEEIARGYLDELINRNLVQVKDMSKDDRVKTCHIHDLLHQLSITKAKEEISFEILTDEGNSESLDKPRHSAIYCSKERFMFYSKNKNKHVRSLFFHGAVNFGVDPSFWKSFELLRVLDFEDFRLEILPDAIGALIGLRYLGLRNTRIWTLPHSLGCLKNLEVLDIAKNFIFMVEVPDILWKMDSLRHLYISAIISKVPLRIDTLINLQTLSCVSMADWTPEHRTNMSFLRKLAMEFDFNSNTNHSLGPLHDMLINLDNLVCGQLRRYDLLTIPSLDGLRNLRSLTKLKLQGELPKLPSYSEFPPKLSYLTLIDTSLSEDPMLVLEKLPNLMYLKLDQAFTCNELVISHDGFPKLKVLTLRWLDQLTDIQVGKGAMPELDRLVIYKCPNLENNIPEELTAKATIQNY